MPCGVPAAPAIFLSLGILTCEGSDGSAFNWTQAFTLDFSDYPRW